MHFNLFVRIYNIIFKNTELQEIRNSNLLTTMLSNSPGTYIRSSQGVLSSKVKQQTKPPVAFCKPDSMGFVTLTQLQHGFVLGEGSNASASESDPINSIRDEYDENLDVDLEETSNKNSDTETEDSDVRSTVSHSGIAITCRRPIVSQRISVRPLSSVNLKSVLTEKEDVSDTW